MPCDCRFRTETILFDAIRSGISQLANLPGALSILRNGGCEQTLRNLLIVKLEDDLDCVAFTEAGKRRIDIALICRKCGEPWANFEIKSNFSTQLEKIPARRLKAAQQLRDSAAAYATHSFYLQIVTHLFASTTSKLGHIQRANVPPYKRFTLENSSLAKKRILARLGADSIADVPVYGLFGDQAEAIVLCWCFYLVDGEEFV